MKAERQLGFRMHQNVMFAIGHSFQLTVKSNVRDFYYVHISSKKKSNISCEASHFLGFGHSWQFWA